MSCVGFHETVGLEAPLESRPLKTTEMPTQLQRSLPDCPVPSPVRLPTASKGRLRVLHVLSALGIGGTEHGVIKLIRALGADEFEHRICAMRGVDHDFARRMSLESMVSSVGSGREGLQFPLFKLVGLMRRIRPHIVHTRNFGALEALLAARIAGVPVAIHSEHGYELQVLGGLPFRRRLVCAALYALADEVFTVSRDLREYHSKQSWRSPAKINVIYNGVNTEQFCPSSEAASSLHTEFGIPPGRVVIGTVGRIVPIKDHASLLEAAEILVRQGKNIHLLIVGSGPALPQVQERAHASSELEGRTTFSGATDRVPEVLKAMDIFVLPSISEGMSNTILEAMASGLPLVVSQAGGNPELVKNASVGYLFRPRDVQALAVSLSSLVDNASLRRGFGRAARELAVEQFSLSRMVRSYRDLYFGLATRRSAWKGL